MRHHFPRWIICFYYPHATVENMGPTGVLPGSQYLQIGRHADSSPSSLLEQPFSGNEPDLAERDRLLAASAAALDPELEEHKVSEYCEYGGTVFVLHFGMLHRACRSMPGAIWRNMFKLQFFRSTAPTNCSWATTQRGPDPDPFRHTGASPEQKAVWDASWFWMRGGRRPGDGPPAPADGDCARWAAALADPAPRAERARIGAAYGTLGISIAARGFASDSLRGVFQRWPGPVAWRS